MNTTRQTSTFRTLTLRFKPLAALALAATLTSLLSGCGGGGGGGSTPSVPASKAITGTLLDAQNAPISGASVVLDAGTAGALTTHTGSTGAYSFAVPLGSITGSDTLSFYDTSGNLIDLVSVTLPTTTAALTVTTVVPPVPPTPPPGV
jgi:hypothetical protein